MTNARRTRDAARSVVGVPFELRTYRNLAYLLLAFPLGIAYFVALTVGFSLTLGLSVTLLGPIALGATLLGVVTLAWVDGALTRELLDVDVSPGFPEVDDGAVEFAKRLLLGRETWVGAVYLVWKFALGVAAFVVLATGFSLAISLLAAPFVYDETLEATYVMGTYSIDTLGRSLVAAGVGAIVGLATLHVGNLLGELSARVAQALLDAAE